METSSPPSTSRPSPTPTAASIGWKNTCPTCGRPLASSNARSDLQKETSEQQELITMQLRRAAIVSPLRTPVGEFGGGLSSLTAGELGATILKALVERSGIDPERRSEEHTSELQSLMRNPYAVFCLKKKIPY